MAEGIANLEATIERLNAAAEGAREATREAHEATKALRLAKREADAVLVQLRDAAEKSVEEQINEQITEGLREYREATRAELMETADRVKRTVQRMANIAAYGNEHGRGTNVFDDMRTTLEWYSSRFEELLTLLEESAKPAPLRVDLPSL